MLTIFDSLMRVCVPRANFVEIDEADPVSHLNSTDPRIARQFLPLYLHLYGERRCLIIS